MELAFITLSGQLVSISIRVDKSFAILIAVLMICLKLHSLKISLIDTLLLLSR